MHKSVLAVALMLSPMVAAAQNQERPFRSYGFGFAGFSSWNYGTLLFSGGSSGTDLHLGLGGEARVTGNLGLGAEIGFFHCTKCYGPASEYNHNVLSVNGSYHFPLSRDSKFLPFVSAGYSVWWSQRVKMFNAGGGVDYWFHRHAGIRFELREYFAGKRDSAAPQTGVLRISPRLSDFRFGVTLR